jgi:hypothetical protein
MGVKGKVQEWCRLVWMGVEMWKEGSKGLDNSSSTPNHLSFEYSAWACFRIGMSGSASFHSVRKS